MSTYFNPVPLEVIPLDLAKADDLNLYGTSLDASFDLVEADIININDDAELWAGVSQKWATETEDVEVEVGKYSSLHWAAKSEDEAIAAGGYAANALISENNSAASEASCDADVVLTHADVTLTHADVVLTDANAIQTSDDVVATNADVVLTGLDAIDTALDVVATNADVVLTGLDAIDTALDVVATNADVVATNADTVSTGLDVVQTGADVIAASDSAADALASEVAAALSEANVASYAVTEITELITSVNTVDVCFSDTTEWRDRCSHTSWENEELNTATRGATAKIPAKVMVLGETSEVALYDLTDGDVPMWRVHDFTGYTVTSVEMLNGKLCVATITGLYTFDYISEEEVWYTTELVNATANDLAMTVLQDAPVDPATGLQVSTIAVATDGGVSVITDGGDVWDLTNGNATYKVVSMVSFNSSGGILFNFGNSLINNKRLWGLNSVPTADLVVVSGINTKGVADKYYPNSGDSTYPGDLFILGASSIRWSIADEAVGSGNGLTLLKENPNTPAEGMVNYITSEYQSGWIQGDIKGAWLADTDDTDLLDTETDADRSVNNNPLTVHGTIARNPVATGAELVAYSGPSPSNYLEQPYNADLDFGTGDFYVMGWFSQVDTGGDSWSLLNRGGAAGASISIATSQDLAVRVTLDDAVVAPIVSLVLAQLLAYHFCTAVRDGDDLLVYIDGELVDTQTGASSLDLDNLDAVLRIGADSGAPMTLWRMGAGAPSAEQIEYIYNWEKKFFQEDAKCTFAGASDSITSLAYDEVTEELGAVTPYGKSILKDGLLVDEEATTVGTPTCIAMGDGDTAFGGTTGVAVYSPAESLRAELLKQEISNPLGFEPFWFVGDALITDFRLDGEMTGWKPKFVYDGGMLVKDGASDEYEVTYDGFIYTVSFAVAPANGNDVCVMGVR